MQVLVAEDELITRRMLEGLLVNWGYDVVTVSDGTSALEILLQDDGPKLAVLDWSMPGLTGLEVCERVREVETPTPPHIILLTARSSSDDVVAGLNAGASDYIRKPFDPQELQARIRVAETVVLLQAHVAQRMQEFEEYVDDSPLGIIMVERDGSISFANSRAYSIFGYEADELLGLPIEELVWESFRDKHYEQRETFFGTPNPRMMAGRETLFGQKKDGSPIPVSIGLNPIPRDTAERVACTILDLTDLKVAEQRLDQFFELSLDVFCIASFEGYLLKVNSALANLLGYTVEELKSRSFYDFFHPDDVALARTQVERLAKGEAIHDFRCRSRNKNGTDYWIEWNAQAVPHAGIIYAAGRNITDRLHIELQQRSRASIEVNLLNDVNAVVSIKDAEGRYEFVNRRHADLFSRNQSTAIGKSAKDFFPEEDVRRTNEEERRIVRTGESITTTEVNKHVDGDHTYVSVKFPVRNSDEQISGTASISVDITEQLLNHGRERDAKTAFAFQQILHPTITLSQSGIDITGVVKASGLRGDFHDYFLASPERLIITLGCMSGSGIDAAIEMTKLSCTTRVLAKLVRSLPVVMAELNKELCQSLPKGSAVNMFLAEIDPSNGGITYLGAGHGALVVRADGTAGRLKPTHGPLGIMASAAFLGVSSVQISPGDVLILCSDGLPEAMNPQRKRFGDKRVSEIVRRNQKSRPRQIIEALYQALDDFTGSAFERDDVTAVVVKVRE